MATALLEGDVQLAEQLLLQSLAAKPFESRALELLSWIHGLDHPHITTLLQVPLSCFFCMCGIVLHDVRSWHES